MSQGTIRIRGARQHNLKNIDLDIRTNEMTVVTGQAARVNRLWCLIRCLLKVSAVM